MTEPADKALLPAGLGDSLPPAAQFEVDVVERLMAVFAGHGYERVKPPLIEFEESLLTGSGAAMSAETFRLMDPVSQRMMGLRPDMTLQVARIATTRLGGAPRPLRLSYAGQVLRVKGTQLRPERQFGQAGAEIVGAPGTAADTEVLLMGARALRAVGIAEISVDVAMPTLVPAVCAGLEMEARQVARLRAALDAKDAAGVDAIAAALPEPARLLLAALLRATGPADEGLARLADLALDAPADTERRALVEVVERVGEADPGLTLTLDAAENRGLEYHTGVTFTFFARGVRGELGRGGRYMAGNGGAAEPATGLTLFLDTILRATPGPAPERRVFVPAETAPAEAARLRDEGWIAIAGLHPLDDAEAEARRLGCDHVLADGTVRRLGRDQGD